MHTVFERSFAPVEKTSWPMFVAVLTSTQIMAYYGVNSAIPTCDFSEQGFRVLFFGNGNFVFFNARQPKKTHQSILPNAMIFDIFVGPCPLQAISACEISVQKNWHRPFAEIGCWEWHRLRVWLQPRLLIVAVFNAQRLVHIFADDFKQCFWRFLAHNHEICEWVTNIWFAKLGPRKNT